MINDEDKLIIYNLKQKLNRWQELKVPYSDLPEDEKEKDRNHARKVLSIFHEKI